VSAKFVCDIEVEKLEQTNRRPNADPYVAAALIAQQAASLLRPESTGVTVVAALYSVTASILR